MWPWSSQEQRQRSVQRMSQTQTRISTSALHRTLHRISRPSPAAAEPVTEAERKMVLTAFIMGGLSIITAFFPLCGLPIAIAGLVMGLSGRRVLGLRNLATWSVLLSTVGLVLALVNTLISLSVHFLR